MRKNIRKKPASARFAALRAKSDRLTLHTPEEAIKLTKETAIAKFEETIDLAVRLGVDSRKSDQNVRGICNLPHGTGKFRKVAVLAKGDQAADAEKAGADIVGGDDLVQRIGGGFKDFDIVIAAENMAPTLAKIGRFLGPKTPNKKSGTLTNDVGTAVKEIKQAARLEYRNDKAGIVHMSLGKATFTEQQLLENFNSAIDALIRAKPSAAKGKYLVTITLSSTMGPGFRVDPSLATKSAGH